MRIILAEHATPDCIPWVLRIIRAEHALPDVWGSISGWTQKKFCAWILRGLPPSFVKKLYWINDEWLHYQIEKISMLGFELQRKFWVGCCDAPTKKLWSRFHLHHNSYLTLHCLLSTSINGGLENHSQPGTLGRQFYYSSGTKTNIKTNPHSNNTVNIFKWAQRYFF